MALLLAGCPQPAPATGNARQCLRGDHCLCRVYGDAKRRCVAKGEGWRWGVGVAPSQG